MSLLLLAACRRPSPHTAAPGRIRHAPAARKPVTILASPQQSKDRRNPRGIHGLQGISRGCKNSGKCFLQGAQHRQGNSRSILMASLRSSPHIHFPSAPCRRRGVPRRRTRLAGDVHEQARCQPPGSRQPQRESHAASGFRRDSPVAPKGACAKQDLSGKATAKPARWAPAHALAGSHSRTKECGRNCHCRFLRQACPTAPSGTGGTGK
jgi:hypothetical protein